MQDTQAVTVNFQALPVNFMIRMKFNAGPLHQKRVYLLYRGRILNLKIIFSGNRFKGQHLAKIRRCSDDFLRPQEFSHGSRIFIGTA